MALPLGVDTTGPDRGLRSCPEWIDDFMTTHKPESLKDFVYLVEGGFCENWLAGLVNSCPKIKDSPLVLCSLVRP